MTKRSDGTVIKYADDGNEGNEGNDDEKDKELENEDKSQDDMKFVDEDSDGA